MGSPSSSSGRDSTARIAPGHLLEVGQRGLAGRSRSSLSHIEAAASCCFLGIIGSTAAAAKD
jgi:hypothetical protein